MQRAITSIFVLFSLGFFTVASAQLPPEIRVDRYLVLAEKYMDEKDYESAFNVMKKILALQKEHNLTLPDEFPLQVCGCGLVSRSCLDRA